jgi:c-di-GMP-binding flagellar brake protein YcgR
LKERHCTGALEEVKVDSQPNPKRIPLNLEPPYSYQQGTRLLVIPADLSQDIHLCKSEVSLTTKDGAWLALVEGSGFPSDEEVYLIEFSGRDVITHRSRILRRENGQVWVGLPSLTEREPSKLAPFTGRTDYRVQVRLPVQVRICEGRAQSNRQWPCQLYDLSRGGMSLVGPTKQPFEKGQKVDVRVVSWEYPVRLETEIIRVWKEGDQQRIALTFPEEMTLNQRELISTFILQVQRRDALGRSLPVIDEGA